MFHDFVRGVQGSVAIYSLFRNGVAEQSETLLFQVLFITLPNLCDEKGNIEPAKLDDLLPCF